MEKSQNFKKTEIQILNTNRHKFYKQQVRIQGVDFLPKQILVKEHLLTKLEVASVPKDFYKSRPCDETMVELIRLRKRKITQIALNCPSDEIIPKLSEEEEEFYKILVGASKKIDDLICIEQATDYIVDHS